MSHPFHSCFFLPAYILEFVSVSDDDTLKIDTQLFLSNASNAQILEIISLLYPHVKFSQDAQDDKELVQKIFQEIVTPNLSNVIVPRGPMPPDQRYFKALIEIRNIGNQDFDMMVEAGTDVNSSRIFRFNCLVVCYLKNGQHRIAANNLTAFVKTHKHLNENEISALDSAYHDTLEGLQESVGFIQNSHQDIEAIGLLLSDSQTSSSQRQELRLRLESATEQLKCRQKIFESTVQAVGFIKALVDYHQKLASKKTNPESA